MNRIAYNYEGHLEKAIAVFKARKFMKTFANEMVAVKYLMSMAKMRCCTKQDLMISSLKCEY